MGQKFLFEKIRFKFSKTNFCWFAFNNLQLQAVRFCCRFHPVEGKYYVVEKRNKITMHS